MSIVACHECGKSVSTEAETCPSCGARTLRSTSAIGRRLLGFLSIAIFLGLVIAFFSSITQSPDHGVSNIRSADIPPPVSAPPVQKAEVPEESSDQIFEREHPREFHAMQLFDSIGESNEQGNFINAAALYAAYNQNEVAADNLYKGKDILVVGMIGSISKDVADDIYVTLPASYDGFEHVQAFLADTQYVPSGPHAFKPASLNDAASSYRKGEPAVLYCHGNGMILSMPELKDCLVYIVPPEKLHPKEQVPPSEPAAAESQPAVASNTTTTPTPAAVVTDSSTPAEADVASQVSALQKQVSDLDSNCRKALQADKNDMEFCKKRDETVNEIRQLGVCIKSSSGTPDMWKWGPC